MLPTQFKYSQIFTTPPNPVPAHLSASKCTRVALETAKPKPSLRQFLALPKYKTSDFNTLPRWTKVIGSLNRSMRSPPGPPIKLGVVALDQQRLIRRHPTGVVPFVIWIRLDVPLLVVDVLTSIDDPRRNRDEVRLVDAAGIAHSKGLAVHWLQGLPDVDNSPTVFGFVPEVVDFGLSV